MPQPARFSISPAATFALGAAATLWGGRTAIRLSRRTNFRGKSVLITGGSRGLGLVLAREFAREGAKITICSRREDELAVAEHDLRSRGAKVLAVQCDVTSQSQVDQMIGDITRHFGAVDVLINNAGVIEVGPAETVTLADFDVAMKTHFWAPLFTTLAVLPQMRQRGDGRIVNISSVGGKMAVPHLLPYCASKFALVGLSEGLRAEVMKDGIYVTTVCPGLMRTGSPRNALFKGRHREEYAWFLTGDALPVTSMSAIRAARQIIQASRYGRAEVILSIQAKLAVAFHDLFPSIATDLNAVVNGLLPGPGGIGERTASGRQSESTYAAMSSLLESDRIAAAANNE